MVRWKVKARFLLNRNRKILPGALYQGHFTGRLKKALASRVPVTPVETVIKRAPFISDALFPTSLVSYRCLFLPFPLSLSVSRRRPSFVLSFFFFLQFSTLLRPLLFSLKPSRLRVFLCQPLYFLARDPRRPRVCYMRSHNAANRAIDACFSGAARTVMVLLNFSGRK